MPCGFFHPRFPDLVIVAGGSCALSKSSSSSLKLGQPCDLNYSGCTSSSIPASRRKGVIFADPVAKGKSKPVLKKNKSVTGNPPIYSSTSTTTSLSQSTVTTPFQSILPPPSILSTSHSQPVVSVSPGPTTSVDAACSQPIVSELLGIDDTRVACTINTCAVRSMASDTSTCHF